MKKPVRKDFPAAPRQTDPLETVYKLWDDLNRFPVGETDETLAHLSRGMAKLLRADNVRWLGAVRVLHGVKAKSDALLGWRLRASYNLVPDPPAYHELIAWWFQRNNEIAADFQIGLATHALISGAGKFRAHQMRDGWIPYAKFRRSDHYRLHYTELGITDRLWLSFPLNADTESVFLIDRTKTPHFSKTDITLATTLLRGIHNFHRQLFLSKGLFIAEGSLSPAIRRIIPKLLTGMSEKEIAASLGQTVATTHTYITSIYKVFGVQSRAGLMALWLGQA